MNQLSARMNTAGLIQGSAQWFHARCAKVTASEIVNVMAFLKRGDKKGGESAGRAAYKAQIVAEILTGAPMLGGYLSAEMQHGNEYEPLARAAYEIKFDVSVDQVGFVQHPNIERAGASPDGLIGENGGLELKCPKTETHIKYMLAGVVPDEYEPQMMWGMACTGREWWDFASFDNRLPQRHQLFRKRLMRNEQRIAEIEAGVLAFLDEVDAVIASLDAMNPEPAKKLREQLDASLGITDDDAPEWMREAMSL